MPTIDTSSQFIRKCTSRFARAKKKKLEFDSSRHKHDNVFQWQRYRANRLRQMVNAYKYTYNICACSCDLLSNSNTYDFKIKTKCAMLRNSVLHASTAARKFLFDSFSAYMLVKHFFCMNDELKLNKLAKM